MRGRAATWVDRFVRSVAAACALVLACLSYSWLTLPDVRGLGDAVPERTAFMRLRAAEAAALDEQAPLRHEQQWMAYGQMGPTLRRAVLVAEDAAFWDHGGLDLTEIRASVRDSWVNGTRLRGSSTITQQLAKNLYLSPARNPYRKVVELLITRRLEAELSKTRILELYLNLIEWGDGVWGAEAAARRYYRRSVAELSAEQAAMLAGAIVNPRLLSPANPNARLLGRQRTILQRMQAARPSSSH